MEERKLSITKKEGNKIQIELIEEYEGYGGTIEQQVTRITLTEREQETIKKYLNS